MENNLQAHTDNILRVQRGDAKAMEALYGQYCKPMFNICTRMMGNGADAEDVLQDAFVLAFKKIHQLKEAAQFGGWLKSIVINECIKQGKKRIGWNEWDDDLHDVAEEETVDWWQEIGMAEINQQIKLLPGGCRQVFTLYAVENYSHKYIAETMKISEGTSKSQYHRAKLLLKERLSKS